MLVRCSSHWETGCQWHSSHPRHASPPTAHPSLRSLLTLLLSLSFPELFSGQDCPSPAPLLCQQLRDRKLLVRTVGPPALQASSLPCTSSPHYCVTTAKGFPGFVSFTSHNSEVHFILLLILQIKTLSHKTGKGTVGFQLYGIWKRQTMDTVKGPVVARGRREWRGDE